MGRIARFGGAVPVKARRKAAEDGPPLASSASGCIGASCPAGCAGDGPLLSARSASVSDWTGDGLRHSAQPAQTDHSAGRAAGRADVELLARTGGARCVVGRGAPWGAMVLVKDRCGTEDSSRSRPSFLGSVTNSCGANCASTWRVIPGRSASVRLRMRATMCATSPRKRRSRPAIRPTARDRT